MKTIAITLSVGLLFITGCSSRTIPTIGDSMVMQGNESRFIGEKWNKGEENIREGEALVAKGERMVAEGQENIKRGEKLIRNGQKLQGESESEYRDKYPEQTLLKPE